MRPIVLTNYIIHAFALFHALCALLLRWLAWRDELALTMLTIAMVVYLSRLWRTPMYVALSLAILACFAGYYVGSAGAILLNSFGIFTYSITTFLVTETLGWVVLLIVKQR